MRRMERLALASAITVVSICGQVAVGGAWTSTPMVDKLTDKVTTVFSLVANQEVANGLLKGKPRIDILCDSGKFRGAGITVPSIVDSSGTFFLRVDQRTQLLGIRIADIGADHHVVTLTKPYVKAFISGTDVRFQFSVYPGSSAVAVFSPTGLDRIALAAACGEKTFR